jgi:ribulose-phosphate 3-epimerase
MSSIIKISPSILSADFSKLSSEISELEKGGADLIHVDVMDGHFVPNITIGPEVIKDLKKHTSLPFDVHLMISPVHKYIKNFAEAGADIITVHPESTNNLIETINEIKKFGKKAGISLNPKTTIEKVMPVLSLIDLVLIMSVNPGFGGQKFIKETLEKVKLLRKEIDQKKLSVEIEIDGGINFDNAKIAKEAGVDILVSGTTIFKNNEGNIKKNIEILRNR